MNAVAVYETGSIISAARVGFGIGTSLRITQGVFLRRQGTTLRTAQNGARNSRADLCWYSSFSSQNCWNPIESLILARGLGTISNSCSPSRRARPTQRVAFFPVGAINGGSRHIGTSKVPATLPVEGRGARAAEGSSSGLRHPLVQRQLLSSRLRDAVHGGRRTGAGRRKQQELQQRQQQIQQQMQQLGLLFQKDTTFLNLENIYLSWMRNGLLATSCAMIAYGLNDWHASVSGMALLSIGGVSLLLGSVRFVLVLPQIAAHCKHARNLRLCWQQLQQPQHLHRQDISHTTKRRHEPDWVTDISVAVHLFVVASVWLLWVVAATGIAGNLPPETRSIISPLVFRRTLRWLESESAQPSDSKSKC